MKKPRTRRKDARPSEILDAALAEFAEKGFAASKLEDVAKRAGVSKATIYVYFADKRALFEACMTSRMAPVFSNVLELIDNFPGTTEQLLHTLILTMHKLIVASEASALLRIVMAESGNFPFLAEMHHRENITRGRAVIERVIARGIARGEFRDGDYAKVPTVVMAPAILAMIWSLLFQRLDPLDMEAVAKAHVDLVLNGILKR